MVYSGLGSEQVRPAGSGDVDYSPNSAHRPWQRLGGD
jgi:hypothetical protein